MEQDLDFRVAARTLLAFLHAHPEVAFSKLKPHYGLDGARIAEQLERAIAGAEGQHPERSVPALRRREQPANRATRQRVIRLAQDILQSPEAVVGRLRRKSQSASPPHDHVSTLRRAADLFARSSEPKAAIAAANLAFAYALRESKDKAVQVLPSVLYYANRCGSGGDLTDTIETVVSPGLAEVKAGRVSPRHASAALGQLACVLNEGGHPRRAAEIFNRPGVRRAMKEQGELKWCGLSIAGNQAHCHLLAEGTHRLAVEVIEGLQIQYTSAANQRSLANTLCRLHLTTRDYVSAWKAVEPYYGGARESLAVTSTPASGVVSGPHSPTPHIYDLMLPHLYETVLLGITAKINLAKGLTMSSSLADEIALLHDLRRQQPADDRSRIELGYGVPLPLPANSSASHARISALSNASIRRPLSGVQRAHIDSLVRLLVGL